MTTRTWEVVTLARWWLVSRDVLQDETLLAGVMAQCHTDLLADWHRGGGLDDGLRLTSYITDHDPASPDYQRRMSRLLLELRGIGYQQPLTYTEVVALIEAEQERLRIARAPEWWTRLVAWFRTWR